MRKLTVLWLKLFCFVCKSFILWIQFVQMKSDEWKRKTTAFKSKRQKKKFIYLVYNVYKYFAMCSSWTLFSSWYIRIECAIFARLHHLVLSLQMSAWMDAHAHKLNAAGSFVFRLHRQQWFMLGTVCIEMKELSICKRAHARVYRFYFVQKTNRSSSSSGKNVLSVICEHVKGNCRQRWLYLLLL